MQPTLVKTVEMALPLGQLLGRTSILHIPGTAPATVAFDHAADLRAQEREEKTLQIVTRKYFSLSQQPFFQIGVEIEAISTWVNDILGRIEPKIEQIPAFPTLPFPVGGSDYMVETVLVLHPS